MSFLVWGSQKEAEDSLLAINAMYGCPYLAENGYRMDRWDSVVKGSVGNDHGFHKPKERLGKKMDDLMPALKPGFIEHDKIPDDFKPEGDDD